MVKFVCSRAALSLQIFILHGLAIIISRFFSECFLRLVETRDRATLVPIIQECIAQGSEVHSNEWAAY